MADLIAVELKSNEATDYISPELSIEFEKLSKLVSEQGDGKINPENKQIVANDILESINNIFKELAEASMWVLNKIGNFVKYSGLHISRDAKKEYEKQLKKLGKSFVKWAFRFLKIGTTLGVGALVGAPLVTMFTSNFGWLSVVVQFIQKLLAG